VRAEGRVAVVGEQLRIEGYALAGAEVCAAESTAEVLHAWDSLPDDVVVVVLTSRAAAALAAASRDTRSRLVAVMT
jgi:vacuolar-type H+-ATPase subunit F/Vma7